MLDQLLDDLHAFIDHRVKNLVVVSADAARSDQIANFIGGEEFQVTQSSSASAALELLKKKNVDCLVLDSEHLDMPIESFVERIQLDQGASPIPVILYSDESPSNEDTRLLKSIPESIIWRQVCSLDRLLDQTAFFLHTPVGKLPEPKRRSIEHLYQTDQVLAGKKVLIVDDDIRNIFALTSILEWRNMVIVSSETGRDAIRILQAEPDIDIVLMDIMMPEMDGLDTMRVIRKLPQFNALPIIAVTAKAMKGDREKCIEAGAWDYLSKPVDTEQLLSVLRVWLHR